MDRRKFLSQSAAGLGMLAGFSGQAQASLGKAQIVVIGGGYGGSTAAKYLRLFSNNTAQVTLIEPNPTFISCPLSNLVVGGTRTLGELTTSYDGLRTRHGITFIQDSVVSIEPDKKTLKLGSGKILRYDKIIVSPGVSLMMSSIEGLAQANRAGITLQAWKAGAQTVALQRQIAAMPDGGIYALSIPEAPYRCPPAPYERACLVAEYFKKHKPKSKVLILDANQDVTSKGTLFKKVWAKQQAQRYRGEHVIPFQIKQKHKSKASSWTFLLPSQSIKAEHVIRPTSKCGEGPNHTWGNINLCVFSRYFLQQVE